MVYTSVVVEELTACFCYNYYSIISPNLQYLYETTPLLLSKMTAAPAATASMFVSVDKRTGQSRSQVELSESVTLYNHVCACV